MQSAAIKEVDAIRDKILSESFGTLRIRDVRAREQAGFDDDGAYVQLVVYAEDPPAGEQTWPVLDIFKLRSRVGELASESEVELPQIVVDVHPQREAEQLAHGESRNSSES